MRIDDEDGRSRRWPVGEGVEVDLDGPYVIFEDGTYAGVDGDYDAGVLPENQIRWLPLSVLDEALGALATGDEDEPGVELWLIDTDPPLRLYDVEPLEGIALSTGGPGELCALIDTGLPRYAYEQFEQRVPKLLGPMSERLGLRTKAPWHPPGIVFDGQFVVMVEFRSMRGRSVGALLDVAVAVRAFLVAARDGDFNRTSARDLLRAGHGDTLLGQPESDWLEAKSQVWDLASAAGKAEAAKDLSALANASGGLLVIPARTSGGAGEEVIAEVRELPIDRFSETQLRDTLARWTYPPLRGVEIDVVARGKGRGYIVIAVPAAASQDWPHFVVGDDRSAFPSAAVVAYIRDGSQNRALTAAQIHGLIAPEQRELRAGSAER